MGWLISFDFKLVKCTGVGAKFESHSGDCTIIFSCTFDITPAYLNFKKGPLKPFSLQSICSNIQLCTRIRFIGSKIYIFTRKGHGVHLQHYYNLSHHVGCQVLQRQISTLGKNKACSIIMFSAKKLGEADGIQ